jgi:hypothetical protein
MKKYPDVSELFRMKAEWRQKQASRPVTEKVEVATRLRNLSKEIPKLTPSKTKPGTWNK